MHYRSIDLVFSNPVRSSQNIDVESTYLATAIIYNYKMIIGIGTDIISVERIKKIIDERGERFLNLIFTADRKKILSE